MPYSSIKEAPKVLKTAGLTLAQMNIWARYYDAAKASGVAISPAAIAWTQFKKLYKKVGKKWIKRAIKLEQALVKKIIFTHFGKEAIEMKHEKLVQKITELSEKYCPNIPVEIAIDNATFGAPSKPVKKSESSQEEILSNYLGSKKAFVEEIMKYIPENTKTLMDPMSGSCHLLIEAAKNGIQIIGNDLCPLAYYYSAGIFRGERLNEKDEKTLKSSPPVSGWLSKSELKRPEKLESKRLLDGLVIGAYKKFSKGKQKAALAAMSLLLQHYFRGFAAFISEEEPYSKEQVLSDLSKCIKDVNKLIEEVGGKGKIFNKNILNETIPRADVIYFDPPYFPSGSKEGIQYFKHYVHANSVLMQKKFEQEDPTKEDITNFLPKLASKTNLLIVSTSSPSAINWEEELSKLKKNVKMIGISKSSTGSQPQGNRANPVAARNVKEHLFCASNSEIKTFKRLEKLLFKLEGYDPSKINDKALNDDLRLCAAKWSSVLQGKKTEFKNKEECLNFGEKVMHEVLKRGKITFHPEYEIIDGKAKAIEK